MSTTRRVFPEVFKREAVDRVISSGLSVGKLATELVLRCIRMIQSQHNRLARPSAGHPRKPAGRVPRLVGGRARPGHVD